MVDADSDPVRCAAGPKQRESTCRRVRIGSGAGWEPSGSTAVVRPQETDLPRVPRSRETPECRRRATHATAAASGAAEAAGEYIKERRRHEHSHSIGSLNSRARCQRANAESRLFGCRC